MERERGKVRIAQFRKISIKKKKKRKNRENKPNLEDFKGK